MDRATRIALNDRLRTGFSGGEVRIVTSRYELDAQLRGRALCVLARCNRFDDGSDHSFGTFVFAGYRFEWWIGDEGQDVTCPPPKPAGSLPTLRVLTLRVTDDLLLRPFR